MSSITGDPVLSGALIYAGTSGGRTSAFEAETGLLRWTAREGALNPVLPVGGSVFLVNDEARLVRLNAGTGEVIWATDMPLFVDEKVKRRRAIFAHYGPVLAGGRLAVASSDGLLRLFDPASGTLVATAEISGGAASAPILANGALYVMGTTGQLHAFR
jgi:outer membrane protein assembly factor BamB